MCGLSVIVNQVMRQNKMEYVLGPLGYLPLPFLFGGHTDGQTNCQEWALQTEVVATKLGEQKPEDQFGDMESSK